MSTPDCVIAADKREVKIGIFQVNPIIFLNDEGKPAGIYVDIIEEIADKEDWQITYVAGTWNEGLTRVKNGEIDLMTSIAFSSERDKLIDFSQEAVVTLWGEVYVHTDSGVQSILDLEGKKIAIMKGDISGLNFQKTAAEFKIDCVFIERPSLEAVLQEVADKKALGGVVPNIFGLSHYQEYDLVKSSIVFSAFSTYFGAPEGKNHDILSTIDQYLKNWKNDKDSFYYNRLSYWLGGEQFEKKIIPQWLLILFATLAGLALLLAIWVKSLRYQVEAHTQELKESEAQLRTLIETLPDLVWLKDPDGAYLSCNPKFERFFGAKQHEI
ncbi:MAG: transporter substrate-binding domain-containing protein, partial [Deltaproteobacteria bacterium]|nr:transporter substrate-binding domain-containing protein [Deltaproteobacteria bacterium]